MRHSSRKLSKLTSIAQQANDGDQSLLILRRCVASQAQLIRCLRRCLLKHLQDWFAPSCQCRRPINVGICHRLLAIPDLPRHPRGAHCGFFLHKFGLTDLLLDHLPWQHQSSCGRPIRVKVLSLCCHCISHRQRFKATGKARSWLAAARDCVDQGGMPVVCSKGGDAVTLWPAHAGGV